MADPLTPVNTAPAPAPADTTVGADANNPIVIGDDSTQEVPDWSMQFPDDYLIAHIFEEHRENLDRISSTRLESEPMRIFYILRHEQVADQIGDPFNIEQHLVLQYLDALEHRHWRQGTDTGASLEMSTPRAGRRRYTYREGGRRSDRPPIIAHRPQSKRDEKKLADFNDGDMIFLDTSFWQVHMRVSADLFRRFEQDVATWENSDKSTPKPERKDYLKISMPSLARIKPWVRHVGLPTSMIWSDVLYQTILQYVYNFFPNVLHFWFFSDDFLRIPEKNPRVDYPVLKTTVMSTAQKRIHGVRPWFRPLEPQGAAAAAAAATNNNNPEHAVMLYEKLEAKALKHANTLRMRGRWNRNPDEAPLSINFRIAQWQLDPPLAYPNDRTEYDAWNPHEDFDWDSDFEANLDSVARNDKAFKVFLDDTATRPRVRQPITRLWG